MKTKSDQKKLCHNAFCNDDLILCCVMNSVHSFFFGVQHTHFLHSNALLPLPKKTSDLGAASLSAEASVYQQQFLTLTAKLLTLG